MVEDFARLVGVSPFGSDLSKGERPGSGSRAGVALRTKGFAVALARVLRRGAMSDSSFGASFTFREAGTRADSLFWCMLTGGSGGSAVLAAAEVSLTATALDVPVVDTDLAEVVCLPFLICSTSNESDFRPRITSAAGTAKTS